MASKELTAIMDLAQQLVASRPQLEKLEALELRNSELTKNINGLSQQALELQATIAKGRQQHSDILTDAGAKAKDIIDEATQRAAEIQHIAKTQADGIVAQAKHNAKTIEEGYASKQKEYNDLIAKTREAQCVHDNIKQILKAMGQ